MPGRISALALRISSVVSWISFQLVGQANDMRRPHDLVAQGRGFRQVLHQEGAAHNYNLHGQREEKESDPAARTSVRTALKGHQLRRPSLNESVLSRKDLGGSSEVRLHFFVHDVGKVVLPGVFQSLSRIERRALVGPEGDAIIVTVLQV